MRSRNLTLKIMVDETKIFTLVALTENSEERKISRERFRVYGMFRAAIIDTHKNPNGTLGG